MYKQSTKSTPFLKGLQFLLGKNRRRPISSEATYVSAAKTSVVSAAKTSAASRLDLCGLPRHPNGIAKTAAAVLAMELGWLGRPQMSCLLTQEMSWLQTQHMSWLQTQQMSWLQTSMWLLKRSASGGFSPAKIATPKKRLDLHDCWYIYAIF